jgi:SAM-dependent methyltransferase
MRTMRSALPLVIALVASCTHAAPAAVPPCPAPAPVVTAPAPATAPMAPPLDEAQVKQRSHDLLDAYDHGDVAAVTAALGRNYAHFEGAKPVDRDTELAQLAKRKPGGSFIATRAWDNETVMIRPDAVVFVGKATETQGGNDVHGGYRFVGWYLLEWVREDGGWKVQLWTWRRGGEVTERDTWNDIFRNAVGFNKLPNKLLVDTVASRKPGAALDLAMGQGRNALYLASRGWKVTGVDISDEGIRLARAEAAAKKLALETINTNVDSWDFGKQRWDLVTMIYAGNDAAWIDKARASLRKGGLFVVEYFAHDPEHGQDDGFLPGQLAKHFTDGFEILRDEVVEDVPDWAMDRAKLVRFVARKR